MENILVTGATGRLGDSVIKYLLRRTRAENISTLVRNQNDVAKLRGQGVNVFIGDYDNYDSLLTAFTGIKKLYFISGNDIKNRMAQHENVVRAATKAKVGHIYYTSFQRNTYHESSPIAFFSASHISTENWIKNSGLTYTILKHGLYTDMLPLFLGKDFLQTGTIFFPAGEGKVSFASRDEMAKAGAELLSSSGSQYDNKSIDIAGKVAYSIREIANALSEIQGKSIRYVSPQKEDFTNQLTDFGVPPEIIMAASSYAEAIAKGELNCPDSTLERILGKENVPIKDLLVQLFFS